MKEKEFKKMVRMFLEGLLSLSLNPLKIKKLKIEYSLDKNGNVKEWEIVRLRK